MHELQDLGERFRPNHLHESWLDYLIGISNWKPDAS
jgi:hypothetical protein